MAHVTVPARIADPDADLAALLDSIDPDDVEAIEHFAAQQPPAKRLRLEAVLAERHAVGWRSDPALFANHLTDGRYRLWPYVQLLAAKFRELCDGTSKRQIWNLPSRYGKTELTSWGVTWRLDQRPEARFIYAPYGDDLANEWAVGVRDKLRANAASLRCTLRRDRQRMDRFVTERGGGVLAASYSSGIIGFGCGNGGGLIVDDPFKNWQEAHSETARMRVWNAYRAVLRTRLDDDEAFVLVVHHRMHERDLTGQLVQECEQGTGEQFEVVSLPALAEHDDPLGREPGEPLEPERYPKHYVLDLHRGMGVYLTSAMEQQHPSPEEGGELKRAYWQLDEPPPARFDDMLSSWDMALKGKDTGDYTVGQVWARAGASYWLLDELRGQFNQAETEVAMCLLAVRWPDVRRHVYEHTGFGPEVRQSLRRALPSWELSDEMRAALGVHDDEVEALVRQRRRGLSGLIPETPKGDKVVRMRAHLGIVEAGDVHIDPAQPFVAHFLDETAAFPNGAHDDRVDACSQALKYLTRSPAVAQAARGQRPQRNPAELTAAQSSAAARAGLVGRGGQQRTSTQQRGAAGRTGPYSRPYGPVVRGQRNGNGNGNGHK